MVSLVLPSVLPRFYQRRLTFAVCSLHLPPLWTACVVFISKNVKGQLISWGLIMKNEMKFQSVQSRSQQDDIFLP